LIVDSRFRGNDGVKMHRLKKLLELLEAGAALTDADRRDLVECLREFERLAEHHAHVEREVVRLRKGGA